MALMRWCCIVLLTTSSLAQVLIRSGVKVSSGVQLANAPLANELPSLVQITSGAKTAVFGQAQNAHDLIVAIVGWNSAGSEDVQAVSDTSGNIYQRGTPVTRGSGLSQTIWYAKDIKAAMAGANTLTVTFTGNPGAPVDTRALEFSGVDVVSPFDVYAAAAGSGNGGSVSSGSAIVNSSGELIVGGGMTTWRFIDEGDGFTQDLIVPTTGDIAEHRVIASSGSYAATAIIANADQSWVMQMATFRSSGETFSNPAPSLLSVVPSTGSAAGGTAVTLNGSNFASGASVSFGDIPATNVIFVSSSKLTATTPAHDSGSVDVEVVNPDGQGAVLSGGFTFTSSQMSGYWLATNGSDSNSGTSGSSPWKTFAYAIKQLKAGDTLIVRNGTYNGTNSGYPNVNCNSNAANGKASAHITIQAENERQAFIKGDGSTFPFQISNCSYWDIVGLHLENGDFNNNGGNDASSADVFYSYNSSHLTLRHNIAARNNRYGNGHLYDLYFTTYSLLEENEGYYFHRHGVLDMQGGYNTYRRNYFNSRGYSDLANGRYSADTTRGDTVFSLYPSHDATVENNISEGNQVLADIQCAYTTNGCYNNRHFGNVSLNDQYGYVWKARDSGDGAMPHNAYAENSVIISPNLVGFYARAGKNSTCQNCTIIGSANTQEGFSSDAGASGEQGDGNYSAYANNTLAITAKGSGEGYGFYISGGAWKLDHPNAWGNNINFYPGTPNANIVSSTSSDPGLGSCKVWLPDNSPMKGVGIGGKDIGASVLYEYQDGSLTTTPLWDPATGKFAGCGATVAGLNDSAGNSCLDVYQRLNVNTNGCNFPAGYGGGSGPTGDVFVSPAGDDSNAGTVSAPVKTLNAAKALADQAWAAGNASGRTAPITVVLRGNAGPFYLTSTQNFTSADSGSQSLPIVYQNYPNESAVISGGKRIIGWSDGGSSCAGSCEKWTASLGNTVNFENLWYNGARRLRPRLGSGTLGSYCRVAGTAGQNAGTQTSIPYDPNDPSCVISGAWTNLTSPYPAGDVEMYLFEVAGVDKMRVDHVDTVNHDIIVRGSGSSVSPLGQERFLIENIKLPDSQVKAQQWFLDRSTNPYTLIYYAAAGENPNVDMVVVPQVPQVLIASGLKYVTFQGLSFEHDNWYPAKVAGNSPPTYPLTYDSTIGYTYNRLDSGGAPQTPIVGAVSCQGCQNVTFDGVTITQTSGSGIDFLSCTTANNPNTSMLCTGGNNAAWSSTNNRFVNGAIYDVGAHGLREGSLSSPVYESDATLPQYLTVENNIVTGYGRVMPKTFGVTIGCDPNNTVQHNEVSDGYSGGIEIGANSCPPPSGTPSTGGGQHGAYGNQVIWNHTWNLGQGLTFDFGCIYLNVGYANADGSQFWVPAANTIKFNRCHDTTDAQTLDTPHGPPAQGIYIDNFTGSADVESNLVYRVSGSAIAQTCGAAQGGFPNLFKNNILSMPMGSVKQEGCTALNASARLFDFTNNLVYFDKGTVQAGCYSCLGSGNPLACDAHQLAGITNFQQNAYWYGLSGSLPAAAFYSSADVAGQSGSCSHTNTYDLAAWQTIGEDQNSTNSINLANVFKNPVPCAGMVGSNCDDYSFPNGSPGVGFAPWDITQSGRTSMSLNPGAVAGTFVTAPLNPLSSY